MFAIVDSNNVIIQIGDSELGGITKHKLETGEWKQVEIPEELFDKHIQYDSEAEEIVEDTEKEELDEAEAEKKNSALENLKSFNKNIATTEDLIVVTKALINYLTNVEQDPIDPIEEANKIAKRESSITVIKSFDPNNAGTEDVRKVVKALIDYLTDIKTVVVKVKILKNP